MRHERPNAPFPPKGGRRLRVADREVDFLAREVRRDGQLIAQRVGIKSLQVLDLLAQRRGEVITREECLNFAWADTLPTDDVLTQAVKGLRRALHDEDDDARMIETVARVGYRLTAPVEWEPTHAPEATATSRSVQPRRGIVLACASARAVLIAVIWIWQQRKATDTHITWAKPSVERVASGPLNETEPRLSPDGTRLAYVLPTGGILMQPSGVGSGRALTTPTKGGKDSALAWGPDGRSVAFQRSQTGVCRVAVVDVETGELRDLAKCLPGSQSLDWSPDGRTLLASGEIAQGGFALHTLSLPGSKWTPIPIERAVNDQDVLARFSPSGQQIAFVRQRGGSDVWLVDTNGRNLRRLTQRQVEVRGLSWAPDGKTLLLSTFFRQSGGPNLGRISIDGRGGIESVGMYADVGRIDVARGVPVVAVEELRGSGSIYWWKPGSAPERLAASSGSDLLASASPDDQSIAFYSDRSGELRLWMMAANGQGAPRLLSRLTPIPRHPPEWDAQSRRLSLLAMDGEGVALFEVDAATGASKRLGVPATSPRLALPQSQDEWDVVSVDAQDRHQLTRWRQGSKWQRLGELPLVADARSEAGAIWFTRTDKRGVFRADNALRTTRLAAPGPSLEDYRSWAVRDGRVWWLERAPWRLRDSQGVVSEVPLANGQTLVPVLRAMAGGFLIGTQSQQIDIGLVRYGPVDPSRSALSR